MQHFRISSGTCVHQAHSLRRSFLRGLGQNSRPIAPSAIILMHLKRTVARWATEELPHFPQIRERLRPALLMMETGLETPGSSIGLDWRHGSAQFSRVGCSNMARPSPSSGRYCPCGYRSAPAPNVGFRPLGRFEALQFRVEGEAMPGRFVQGKPQRHLLEDEAIKRELRRRHGIVRAARASAISFSRRARALSRLGPIGSPGRRVESARL